MYVGSICLEVVGKARYPLLDVGGRGDGCDSHLAFPLQGFDGEFRGLAAQSEIVRSNERVACGRVLALAVAIKCRDAGSAGFSQHRVGRLVIDSGPHQDSRRRRLAIACSTTPICPGPSWVTGPVRVVGFTPRSLTAAAHAFNSSV